MKVKDFTPYVLPDVMGCPAPLLRQAIVAAAQEFCRDTLSWSELQEAIPLVDGVPEYELDIPSQAMVASVRAVWCGVRRLRPVSMDGISTVLPNWQTATGSEPVLFNMAQTRGTLRVFPSPANTTGQALAVLTAFQPTMRATSLPDFLGDMHMEVIASGAKARLMAMSGKAWSNPNLAGVHKGLFTIGMDDARISEEHGRVAGSISVAPRTFG
jgi:hypothetical protein